MEKIIEFTPAFDKRNPDPNKNYGVHGVEIRFVLKGPLGATQFVLLTNWQLPHVQEEFDARRDWGPDGHFLKPFPTDLGYHSPKPMYDGQEPMKGPCQYVDGGVCYYDGSSLAADDVFKRLLAEGTSGVWNVLEETYNERFTP